MLRAKVNILYNLNLRKSIFRVNFCASSNDNQSKGKKSTLDHLNELFADDNQKNTKADENNYPTNMKKISKNIDASEYNIGTRDDKYISRSKSISNIIAKSKFKNRTVKAQNDVDKSESQKKSTNLEDILTKKSTNLDDILKKSVITPVEKSVPVNKSRGISLKKDLTSITDILQTSKLVAKSQMDDQTMNLGSPPTSKSKSISNIIAKSKFKNRTVKAQNDVDKSESRKKSTNLEDILTKSIETPDDTKNTKYSKKSKNLVDILKKSVQSEQDLTNAGRQQKSINLDEILNKMIFSSTNLDDILNKSNFFFEEDENNEERKFEKFPSKNDDDSLSDIIGDIIFTSRNEYNILYRDKESFINKIEPTNRLNIFTKSEEPETETAPNIMDIVDSVEYRRSNMIPPDSQFHEWIQWTKDKKIWQFPIDNEQDSEELNVGFEEHVFPQQYLSGRLPTTGLVGQFMNYVCIGLSQNPHLTVEKKKEHIQWYEEYLSNKLDEIDLAMEKDIKDRLYEENLRNK